MKKPKEYRKKKLVIWGALIPMLHIMVQFVLDTLYYIIHPESEKIRTCEKYTLTEKEQHMILKLYDDIQELFKKIIDFYFGLNLKRLEKLINQKYTQYDLKIIWNHRNQIQNIYKNVWIVDNMLYKHFDVSMIYKETSIRKISNLEATRETLKIPWLDWNGEHCEDEYDIAVLNIKDGDFYTLADLQLDFNDWLERYCLYTNDRSIFICRFFFWLTDSIDFSSTASEWKRFIWSEC